MGTILQDRDSLNNSDIQNALETRIFFLYVWHKLIFFTEPVVNSLFLFHVFVGFIAEVVNV